GVILADNVLFRGYVRGDKEPPKRFKTIVNRLQEYLTYVEYNELFNTTIYPMGDGMSVSVWKGHNK
ncbi:MAG: O-methyltransferase, partial [Veillonella sp.]|nr:O-methyltransferase [Veillonella sp.]